MKIGKRGEQISATQTCHRVPSRWAIFVIFWKKMAILMGFGSHFSSFQSHLKEQNF